MTYLVNDPSRFPDEAVDGFAAAHRSLVRRVPGGVIRNARSEPGTVALIIGGGSGHYPAFAGLVGRGMAHGAAIGNIFASPSSQQIRSVARAVSSEGGILFSYGNYAGDVLNFGAAAEQLISEGTDVRQVLVTDDVSSAPPDQTAMRRGVAGDVVVFKIAGAAADQGRSLDEVTRLANLANQQTRSFGVALSGCTLPGARTPLFTVPDRRMAVGLGVHGEPGVGETDLASADGVAALLVSTLLAELPPGVESAAGQRVTVLLNGLGAVKYEELFVVYRRVDQLLSDAGIEIFEPEVGELVTSLDMAGISLTLCWLTDELSSLWHEPADAAGFRKGYLPASVVHESTQALSEAPEEMQQQASAASQAATERVLAALEAAELALTANAVELGRLDSVAGDGDHGSAMSRGARAALDEARQASLRGAGIGTLLKRAADAWANAAGGTSGALWGVMLRAAGESIGDNDLPDAERIDAAIQRCTLSVRRVGKAAVGDKTLVDALVPFSETMSRRIKSGLGLAAAWDQAATAAEAAAAATSQLLARVGRARPLGSKSLGTPDPGATSLALVLRAVQPLLASETASIRQEVR